MERSSNITVTVHGCVQSADFPYEDNICVKLSTVTSGEWKLINGDEMCLSAFAHRGSTHKINIDLPFSNSFRSSTPFMWPRYVITIYSKKSNGNDNLIGYGSLFVPTTPGRHKLRIWCFLPEPSSFIQQLISRARGLMIELVNPLMSAFAEGRYALRVSTCGYIDVEIFVQIKSTDVFQFGNNDNDIKPRRNITLSRFPDDESSKLRTSKNSRSE